MASSRSSVPPSLKPLDLDITVVSAKHLKNVNWRHGCLKPYVIFWIDPERRIATKPDDSGSTRPVWNERFTLPVSPPPHSSSSFSLYEALLTLEIFHSKPSETPKPLVGTLRFPLKELLPPGSGSDSDSDTTSIRTLDLHRPSGRPHGKIRLKLALRERPPPPPPSPTDYHYYPPHSPSPPPPPPFLNPPRDYREGYPHPPPPFRAHHPPPSSSPSPSQYPYGGYTDPYAAYYYSQPPPPPPPRPFFDRMGPGSYSSAGGPCGPSAPVDYSSSPYEHKQKGVGGGKMGLGAGLAVGTVAGALGGLALEEGIKYEEDKIADRVESNISGRDDFNSYPGDY